MNQSIASATDPDAVHSLDPTPGATSTPALPSQLAPALSVVVIGRNEGPRLSDCLRSVLAMQAPSGGFEVIYVDSDSTDDSVVRAEGLGARVVRVKPERPTAAIGRNAGWRLARAPLVLFLDGDTLLDPLFVQRALPSLDNPAVAGVCGDRRESRPGDSVYNRVLDLDWLGPEGEVEYCGGDALTRRDVLARVGGFDETLIAGEEPDLWRRIRGLGLRVVRLNIPMTSHDLAMTRWSQYWRRATRTGHAYAEVSERWRDSALPLWYATAVRNRIHALGLIGVVAAALLTAFMVGSIWPMILLILALLILFARTAWRQRWRGGAPWTLFLYGVHSHLQQLPILFGQLGYFLARRSGRRRGLIEYKR
jgi:cellulose synthase/poly-beta-1,6-N-acetylglucosamine synthase-like glycosyltransferase